MTGRWERKERISYRKQAEDLGIGVIKSIYDFQLDWTDTPVPLGEQ